MINYICIWLGCISKWCIPQFICFSFSHDCFKDDCLKPWEFGMPHFQRNLYIYLWIWDNTTTWQKPMIWYSRWTIWIVQSSRKVLEMTMSSFASCFQWCFYVGLLQSFAGNLNQCSTSDRAEPAEFDNFLWWLQRKRLGTYCQYCTVM